MTIDHKKRDNILREQEKEEFAVSLNDTYNWNVTGLTIGLDPIIQFYTSHQKSSNNNNYPKSLTIQRGLEVHQNFRFTNHTMTIDHKKGYNILREHY